MAYAEIRRTSQSKYIHKLDAIHFPILSTCCLNPDTFRT